MADLLTQYQRDGFVVFDADPRVARWAAAARGPALKVTLDPEMQARWLRHGKTWFVGVDALPNGPDGAVGGVPLDGPWDDLIAAPGEWHPAQVSVTYKGYPQQDDQDSDAAHRFRLRRCAAHVDGLHLEDGRRIVREPHAFILGIPLNNSTANPLMVWPGSHTRIRQALRETVAQREVMGCDVTESYTSARAACFEDIEPVPIRMEPGQAVLLDRHMLHGVAPWAAGDVLPDEGRMVAYFRPLLRDSSDWLRG